MGHFLTSPPIEHASCGEPSHTGDWKCHFSVPYEVENASRGVFAKVCVCEACATHIMVPALAVDLDLRGPRGPSSRPPLSSAQVETHPLSSRWADPGSGPLSPCGSCV